MDEYIEREAAIRMLRGSAIAKYPLQFSFGIFASAEELEKLPSADVAPARHGRWLSWDELHGGNTLAKNVLGVFCSECILQSDSKTHFCPNCGAKMDGDASHKMKR